MANQISDWGDYINESFLKAADVKGPEQVFAVVNIEEVGDIDSKTLRLTLESSGSKYLLDLNKTNSVFLKNNGISHPNAVVGKKISFKKVIVVNPSTHKEVEGLRIASVN